MIFPILTMIINGYIIFSDIFNWNFGMIPYFINFILFGIVPFVLLCINKINIKKYTMWHLICLISGFALIFLITILSELDNSLITNLIFGYSILTIISFVTDVQINERFYNADFKNKYSELVTVILSNPCIPVFVFLVALLIDNNNYGFTFVG